jgi:hypothetical protein
VQISDFKNCNTGKQEREQSTDKSTVCYKEIAAMVRHLRRARMAADCMKVVRSEMQNEVCKM